jgi:indolepyruvate ferredoxin oxidoreductase
MLMGFRLLARLKGLRGGIFDVFGRTEERRQERALIAEYRSTVAGLLGSLSRANLDTAIAIASVPEDVRGYGHVKERHLKAAREKQAALLANWRDPVAEVKVA